MIRLDTAPLILSTTEDNFVTRKTACQLQIEQNSIRNPSDLCPSLCRILLKEYSKFSQLSLFVELSQVLPEIYTTSATNCLYVYLLFLIKLAFDWISTSFPGVLRHFYDCCLVTVECVAVFCFKKFWRTSEVRLQRRRVLQQLRVWSCSQL